MFIESLDDFKYPRSIGTLPTPVDHHEGGVQVQHPEGNLAEDSHDSHEENSRHPDTPDNTKLDQEETEETAGVKLETESHKLAEDPDTQGMKFDENDKETDVQSTVVPKVQRK